MNGIKDQWRQLLLVSVIGTGVVGMSGFKISLTGGDPWYGIVAIFAEVAAGVASMSQALLRATDARSADRAFIGSILLRIALVLAGIQLFMDKATVGMGLGSLIDGSPATWPDITASDRFTWSALITYCLAHAVILLIEWMFAHILSREYVSVDTRLAAVTQVLEKAQADIDEAVQRIPPESATTAAQALADRLASLEGKLAAAEAATVSMKGLAGILFRINQGTRGYLCPHCFTFNKLSQKSALMCSGCQTPIPDGKAE